MNEVCGFCKRKNRIFTLIGAICLAIPVLFLDHTVIAGMASVTGFILLICGGRMAYSRIDYVLNFLLLWIGSGIRFSTLFGPEILYTLLSLLMYLPVCILITLGLIIEEKLRSTGHEMIALFIVPAVYTLISFIMAICGLGFISNLMGYAMEIPVLSGNLVWLGEYGMTFLLMMFFSCISGFLFLKGRKQKLFVPLAGVLILIVLTCSGKIINSGYGEPDYTINVAFATSQKLEFTATEGNYSVEQQLDLFTKTMDRASHANAKLLVLNEEFFIYDRQHAEIMPEKISEIVRYYHIPVVAGILITDHDDLCVNEAVYFDNNGEMLCTYVKNNLVPFIETGYCENGPDTPPAFKATIDGHEIDLAMVICFDLNDDTFLKKIPETTELLIAPSWDWDTTNIEQKRTRIRSSSLGLTLIKHTFDGYTYVSCPNGECAEMIDLRKCYEMVVTSSVPVWEK